MDNKILLSESEIPRAWYNIIADLPGPPPPVLHPATGQPIGPPDLAPLFPPPPAPRAPPPPVLHPATGQPIGPQDLAPLFPMALIGQEVSGERYIEIPEEVQEIYRLWRPTPPLRAPPP